LKGSMQERQSRRNCSKKKSNLVLLFLAMLFIGLSFADAFKWIHPIDVSISNFVQSFKNGLLTQVAVFISWFGEAPQGYVMLVLSAVALYVTRLRWEAVVLIVSNIIAIASEELIKIIVRSPGPGAPSVPDLIKVTDYTFPSGHVIFYITFFGLIYYYSILRMEQKWTKAVLLIPIGILIALVGVSRVYLLEHWYSDVIGGYLLGGMILIITILCYKYGIVHNIKLSQRK